MLRIFFYFLITILTTSCKQSIEYKVLVQPNQYAKHFNIDSIENGYSIKVINPYQGAISDTFYYQLSTHKNSSTIHIPIKKAIIFSTTYIGYFDTLDALSIIKGISGTQHIYNPKVNNKIKQNEILEIGYDNYINYEAILKIKPDVVFAYSVSKESLPFFRKIEQLNIPVIYVAEYLENTALGRAEWIKFFATFLNKKSLADSIFNSIKIQYLNLAKASKKNRPQILLNIPFEGIWYLPTSQSYFTNLINDAGGHYLYSKKTGSILQLSFEEVLEKNINCDIWLNPGQVKSLDELSNYDKRFMLFKAYKNRQIYNCTKRINANGGNDFWESAVVNPHLLLKDLITIFQQTNDSLYYYKRLL